MQKCQHSNESVLQQGTASMAAVVKIQRSTSVWSTWAHRVTGDLIWPLAPGDNAPPLCRTFFGNGGPVWWRMFDGYFHMPSTCVYYKVRTHWLVSHSTPVNHMLAEGQFYTEKLVNELKESNSFKITFLVSCGRSGWFIILQNLCTQLYVHKLCKCYSMGQ